MACVRRFEVLPPETRNKCDAIFKSRVVAVRHSPHILGPAGVGVGKSARDGLASLNHYDFGCFDLEP